MVQVIESHSPVADTASVYISYTGVLCGDGDDYDDNVDDEYGCE